MVNGADEILRPGREDRVALLGDWGELTYGALNARVNQWGHGLGERGVGRGDRVVLSLDDDPALVAAYLGAMRLGAVPVAVNPRWSADEMAFALDDSEARCVVTDAASEPTAREAMASLARRPAMIVAGTETVADWPDSLDSAVMATDDMAYWIYTSGTTGSPKAAVHRHGGLRVADRVMRQVLGLGPDDRLYASSRLFFAYSLGHCLFGALQMGASTVLNARWPHPPEVAELVARHRPTALFSVPTFYRALLEHGVGDLGTVRRFVSAGERMPEPLFARWREAAGRPIVEGIGTTETALMFLANPPEATRAGSAGRPTPGARVKLTDETGRPVTDADAPGHLWVAIETLCAGYWKRPEATAAAFEGGWFRTGDVFRFDADGYGFHEGRSDDMLKIAGQWVNPVEIEDCVLAALPDIEVALVAAPDGDGLDRTVLFVTGAERDIQANLTARIHDAVAARLGRHKSPHAVRYIDALPRTATGKIRRATLRAEAAGLSG